jgi:SPP1 gp7 family putative phage head morphogenesis protein
VNEELVRETEKLLLASYLLGRDHAGSRLELADTDSEVPALSFDEALKFAKARVPLTRAEWATLEPELRFRAFTVAVLSTHDNIEKVRQMSIKAVENGTPLSEFWTEAKALDAAGLGSSPWYWETVYRTNSQTCYNAGRAAEFTRTQPEYLEFVGIEDKRQTDICNARSGVIRPASDPWWRSNWPPLHFDCRSTVRAVYQEEIDLLREADPTWTPTPDSMITRDPAAKGFGSNPIETGSFYKLTPGMIARAEEAGVIDNIKEFGKTLGLRYDAVTLSQVANKAGITAVEKTIPAGSEGRAALRKAAKETLGALRNQPFINAALGESIVLSKTGIDHAVSFAGDPAKLAILDRIPDIIQNAVDFTVEAEGHGNPGYTEILRGKATIEVNGGRNLFAVILKRKKDGTLIFYDLMPWEQK